MIETVSALAVSLNWPGKLRMCESFVMVTS